MTALFEDATMRDLNIAHYCANGSASHPTNMHSSYNSVHHHLTFSDASNVCTFISCHIRGTNWKLATEREFEGEVCLFYEQVWHIPATSINMGIPKNRGKRCYEHDKHLCGNKSALTYVIFFHRKSFFTFSQF